MKKLIIIALAASLGGCATQFGTRVAAAVHPHHHRIVAKAPAPVVAAHVVAPAPGPPAPEKPKSFFQRHAIKWLHD
jgi:hypothetical protein